jgi:hypothetical protein
MTMFSSCVVWLHVHGVIMNERNYVTCCAPVELTFLVLGTKRVRNLKLSSKFTFPPEHARVSHVTGSVVWEQLLHQNGD